MHTHRIVIAVLILLAISGRTFAADGTESVDFLKAENRLLHEQILKQNAEIAALRARVAELASKQVESRPPTSRPSTAAPPAANVEIRTDRVVFALDATGSMMNKFAEVRDQAIMAIQNLKPSQRFGIVILRLNQTSVFSPALLPASSNNIARAIAFLNMQDAGGSGDLAPLVRSAAALNPDVIWLASDGDSSNLPTQLPEILSIRGAHKWRINTASFADESTPPECVDLLREIADRTGGKGIDKDGNPIPTRKLAPTPRGPSIFDSK